MGREHRSFIPSPTRLYSPTVSQFSTALQHYLLVFVYMSALLPVYLFILILFLCYSSSLQYSDSSHLFFYFLFLLSLFKAVFLLSVSAAIMSEFPQCGINEDLISSHVISCHLISSHRVGMKGMRPSIMAACRAHWGGWDAVGPLFAPGVKPTLITGTAHCDTLGPG